MKVVSLEVQNYKCFWEKQAVTFSPCSTAILGRNNVGKTALLDCLTLLNVPANPHRSSLSLPSEASTLQKPVRISLKVSLEGQEMIEAYSTPTSLQFWIPNNKTKDTEQGRAYAVKILQSPQVLLTFTKIWTPPLYNSPTWEMGLEVPTNSLLNFGATQKDQGYHFSQNLPIPDVGSIFLTGTSNSRLIGPNEVLPWISRSIFRFDAERFNVGASKVGPITKLAANAENLPTVLSYFGLTWRTRFQSYLAVVREVLPTVADVAVVPVNETHVEIRISADDNYENRQDLAQLVRNCGTGICQVLAMLYVATFERTPQVIILDEPDSFLHPGAARKLMQILRKNEGRHQYIISTHSTEIIRGSSPDSIAHIVWDRPRARVKMLDPTETEQMWGAFSDLGIQLSDIYGAEAVIWVEGATERAVLPEIWAKARPEHTALLEFLPVAATGDFNSARRKHRELVARIYRELSTAKSLMPPAVGFLFDRDDKTPGEIDDMVREHGGNVAYLPRRTLENYLLDCDAIAGVLKGTTEGKAAATADDVLLWINEHGSKAGYFDPLARVEVLCPGWTENVNAPKLLSDIFDHFAKIQYRKTLHSVQLARILLERDLGRFDEIVAAIEAMLADHHG